MLSAKDIADLEKKYSRYIMKKRFKSFLFLFMFILLASSTTYYFLYFYKTEVIVKRIQPKANMTDENISILFSNKDKNRSFKRKAAISLKTIKKSPITKNDNTPKKDLNKTVISKENNTTKNNMIFKIYPSNTFKVNHSNTKILVFSFSQKDKTPTKIIKTQQNIAKNINKNATITSEDDKKPKISIEMKDIDSIKYLNDKFKKTHDIVFALMLCESYYKQKDYKNSLKWSIIANDIDSSGERSWIWFAKSKYRLHQKNDAIKALRSFLKSNSSENVKSLLNDIINGVMND